MAVYARSEDLVRIGAYKLRARIRISTGLCVRGGAMRAFMNQDAHEQVRFADCLRRLSEPG